MKEETKVELLKIAAQLAVTSIQYQAGFGKSLPTNPKDIKEAFEKSVALAKEQFESLS